MKEANIHDMELGNLVFGHSRGNYHINRDAWQGPFCKFLERNGFDVYGYREVWRSKEYSDECYYENDTFIIRPYYWGDDEEEAALPNFVYKPTGFTISWYKYPMRDAYASMNITDETFFDIIKHCEESMKGEENDA